MYDGSSADQLGFTKITINNVYVLGNIKNADIKHSFVTEGYKRAA